MCKICVFAGTTEGRELVEFLRTQNTEIYACVATEYGQTLLQEGGNLTVSAKRLNKDDMTELFTAEKFDLVVDATHPYAPIVTDNILEACGATGTEYVRLLRENGGVPEGAVFVSGMSEAAEMLAGMKGNILFTTGSKELKTFASVPGFAERAYARVLPMEDSIKCCRDCGLASSHIIAVQGPFSREMNKAMIAMTDAKIVVTKEAGVRGGFMEKAEAALECGALLLVVGRPAQVEGLTFADILALLSDRFGFSLRPRISIVGIGPGSADGMTVRCRKVIESAECLIGAQRMIEASAHPGQLTCEAVSPDRIMEAIRARRGCRSFAVVMSGDVGFFSGAKKLLPLLSDYEVELVPGVSSMVFLASRLGMSYEDIVPVSTHGRECDIVGELRKNKKLFVLVGGENGMKELCQSLDAGGYGDAVVHVGQRLGYPDENVSSGTASLMAQRSFSSLSACVIERSGKGETVTHGLPDELFQRSEGDTRAVPMTKSEVRSVAISKLTLTEDAVCYDIGAGTGSVSVELALQASSGTVYAVERREDAIELLEANKRKFHVGNMHIVRGTAPEACEALPPPTHAFIGGSSGNMKEILSMLLAKNPHVRIVATAIALESVAELTECANTLPFREHSAVSMTVARSKKAGAYHLMTAQNPVYIFTFQG